MVGFKEEAVDCGPWGALGRESTLVLRPLLMSDEGTGRLCTADVGCGLRLRRAAGAHPGRSR